MRNIVITKHGSAREAFQCKEQEDLKPKNLEVLVEVEGFGLNYADVMARQGLYKEAPDLPFVPGYEIVGKVIQQGNGVLGEFEGKRVVAFTRFGGYAERAVADTGELLSSTTAFPQERPVPWLHNTARRIIWRSTSLTCIAVT